MNTPAIHQAMRLEKHPEEMAWLCFPASDYPDGITDLLKLCSSKERLIEFSNANGFDPEDLSKSLFNFIEKAIVNENNSDEKILGTDKFSSSQIQKYHYQLLMKIYHPDLSDRPNSEHFSSLISKAYKKLKDKEKAQEKISFSENRRPPKSYYQATKKAESQISNTKSAIAIVSTLTIFAFVAFIGKLFDPTSPELVTNNDSIQVENTEPQSFIKVIATKPPITPPPERILATSTRLQMLLKELETAYEDGNVDAIKPILANAPEIRDQSAKELNDKLETLFKITDERKMVLFDFNWTNVSGTLKGKGKFLSRYKLVGETKWLTREGIASISAKKDNIKLKVTQFILENQTID